MMYRDFFNGKLLLDYIKILLKIWHIDFFSDEICLLYSSSSGY